LDYVHSKKILHRDLKAGNIFLTKSGQIKLGDFGIARVLNKTMDMAVTSIGTPLYMSPECCNNKPYSFKSDVWSLGCVIYELVNQCCPFNATDLRGLFMKIIRGVYAPVKSSYSSSLRTLIDRMLVTSHSKRPTVRTILQSSFLTKNIVDYSASFNFESVATTMDVDSIEQNNLRSQITELGIVKTDGSGETPRPPSSSRSQSSVSSSPKVLERTPPKIISPYAQPLVKKTPPKLGVQLRPKVIMMGDKKLASPEVGKRTPEVKKPVEINRNIHNRINIINKDKERVNEAMEKLKREREERIRLHEERMKKINKEREEKLEALKKRLSPRPVVIKARC
jgi:serine/threonine protein kinase